VFYCFGFDKHDVLVRTGGSNKSPPPSGDDHKTNREGQGGYRARYGPPGLNSARAIFFSANDFDALDANYATATGWQRITHYSKEYAGWVDTTPQSHETAQARADILLMLILTSIGFVWSSNFLLLRLLKAFSAYFDRRPAFRHSLVLRASCYLAVLRWLPTGIEGGSIDLNFHPFDRSKFRRSSSSTL